MLGRRAGLLPLLQQARAPQGAVALLVLQGAGGQRLYQQLQAAALLLMYPAALLLLAVPSGLPLQQQLLLPGLAPAP